MRSIERRFKIISLKDDLFSTFICFSKAVSGCEFSKKALTKWFNVLVDKNDYQPTDKKALISHLVNISKEGEFISLKNWLNGYRNLAEYYVWRDKCLERDGNKCTHCSSVDNLEVDHTKQFARIIIENKIHNINEAKLCEELWDISNGRTLCTKCPRKTETHGLSGKKMLQDTD